MCIIMAAGLYTSRVILDSLGATDYGLYNVVGGIVTMLAFINGTAAGATARFLMVALGAKKEAGYDFNKIFNNAFAIHLVLAAIVAIVAEVVGNIYIDNYMVIAAGRVAAARLVLHISILTAVINFTQVPYNATLIAHERMNAFAAIGIVEALAKLGIAYLIYTAPIDRLVYYAALLLVETMLVSLLYRIYTRRAFGASAEIHFSFDRPRLREMLHYSGWDLVGSLGYALETQGVNMLLNMFFGPAVNAARAIAYQAEGGLYTFVTNFLTAVKPAITKSYAAGDIATMNRLVTESSRLALCLFSALAVPFLLECDYILALWLKNPPEDTAVFLRILLVMYMINTLNNVLQIAIHAIGDVKRLNIYGGMLGIITIPIIYAVLSLGAPAYSVFIILLIYYAVADIPNLYVLKKNVVSFQITKFLLCGPGHAVMLMLLPIVVATLVHTLTDESLLRLLTVSASYVLTLCAVIYRLGLTAEQRSQLTIKIKQRIGAV